MNNTGISMATLKLSNKKSQDKVNISESTQLFIVIYTGEPDNITS